MLFDIKGHLNSTNLAVSKALWPLFEAVVNSIQAIEDSNNKDCGRISVFAERELTVQNELGTKEPVGRIESFTITDNGSGFNSENYKSFCTACSTYKLTKGCKGIGRFLWLKAFESVNISSTFCESGKYYTRNFVFSSDMGISPETDNLTPAKTEEQKTEIKLCGFFEKYRSVAPVELDVIAKKIIEHCLPFFISGNCPEIILSDRVSTPINLNQYFEANIKDTLHQDHFSIKDTQFTIYHLRLPEGAETHKLHLCANMQEVESFDLKKYIPDMHRKIVPIDEPVGFYYVGYVVSQYLDSIVNPTRTAFEYDETDDQISISGTGKSSIVEISISFIKSYLSDYLGEIAQNKRKQIDDFVQEEPVYRYLLKVKPEIYDRIPAGLSATDLEMELHKGLQRLETEIKIQGQQLDEAAKKELDNGDITYKELFEKYWTGVTELSKTYLAEYVTRRKTILQLLKNALTIQDNGRFKTEDVIHSLICPMRHTSDDVQFEEMNLWVIDERLAYHQFLASDKTIKSLPGIDSNSTKELDIAIFDRAFAFSDDDSPLNTITIIEFKKPDNKTDNPLSQMGRYIDEIVEGKKKRANGLTFGNCEKTAFRCYAICDLTKQIVAHCKDAGFQQTPDGMGYYGYQPGRNAYYEVISYSKLLADAEKRNKILFDKLFAPKPDEVIHISDVKEDK